MPERKLYVMVPNPPRGKETSLDVMSGHPCRMRMPAPCGSLWKDEETCQRALDENDSLRDDFVAQPVMVFRLEDYRELGHKIDRLSAKLRELGYDPKEIANPPPPPEED